MGRWFPAIEACLQCQAKSSRVDDGGIRTEEEEYRYILRVTSYRNPGCGFGNVPT
jgi:hypothetical protein